MEKWVALLDDYHKNRVVLGDCSTMTEQQALLEASKVWKRGFTLARLLVVSTCVKG